MSLFETELPDGLRWATVGDFYEVTRKPRNLPIPEDGLVPFIPMEQISLDGSFEATYLKKPVESITSGTYIERGDILVAKITPSFENGKQALVEALPSSFAYATTEVIPLHGKNGEQNHRLLFYYLLHPDVRSHVAGKMEGSTGRQRVPEGALLDLPFPDFDSSDQGVIANTLGLVQSSIRVEQEALKCCRELRQTVMREVFTRGLLGESQKETAIGPIPESWDVVGLGSLGRIGNGSTPKRDIKEYWEDGYYPWLTSAKVYDRLITAADEFVTDEALARCHLPRVKAGSLVMAITGQGKTLGNCALLGIEATVSQHLAYVSLDPSEVVGSYIRGYLETRYGYLRDVASGGGSTKGALTCAFLRDLPIPLPPTRIEQQEIADVLDAIDQKIDLHKQKKAALEQLFRTLLHKLMTGKVRVSDLDLSALETAPTAEVTA
jgi:type I restriction enzyme S subunit